MSETLVHNIAQRGVEALIMRAKQDVLDQLESPDSTATTADAVPLAAVAPRLRLVKPNGTAAVRIHNVWNANPDVSFRERGVYFPSLVAEIAFAQSTEDAEEKARGYMRNATTNTCRVRAVIIIDIAYPSPVSASLSLLAVSGDADEASWVMHRQTFYDATAETQPTGHVELYASDFLGSLGSVPLEMRRPAPVSQCLDDGFDTASSSAPGSRGQMTINFADLRLSVEEAVAEYEDCKDCKEQLQR
ncbi:hypothetical protein EsH8_VII_000024 [Colletotrichum jinshuiense]